MQTANKGQQHAAAFHFLPITILITVKLAIALAVIGHQQRTASFE
jgi:hypothetical protein